MARQHQLGVCRPSPLTASQANLPQSAEQSSEAGHGNEQKLHIRESTSGDDVSIDEQTDCESSSSEDENDDVKESDLRPYIFSTDGVQARGLSWFCSCT